MRVRWRGFQLGIVLAAFATSASAAAQPSASISGRALDATGRPLAGVSVKLAPPERVVETDPDGRFAFDGLAAGRYTLTLTTPLGRAEVVVDLAEGQPAIRDLTLGSLRVSESVAVSGVAPDGLNVVPGGTAVVDRSDILDSRANNFKDAFELTPGVLAQPRFGADESQFSIRGSGLRNNFHVRGV